jgi:hypothetical protein
MKVINAKWEKRNLGVDCIEVKIESQDNIDILKERSNDYQTEYTVIKVPIGMMDICHYLQSAGYFLMELMTICYSNANLPRISPIQKRIIDSVNCEEMNRKDRDLAFKHINDGMFNTDRISIDTNFTQEQANKRYIGWISDDLNLQAKIYKIVSKGEAIGFFTLKHQGGGSYITTLGGLYPGFVKPGLGISILYHTINEAINQNANKLITAFSSNNRGAAALHFSLGLVLDQQHYVFVKHRDKL